MNDIRRLATAGATGNSQPVHRTTNRVYAKRVPSALTPERQKEAVLAVRAGISVHQVAAANSVSESVILELWNRDTIRRTQEFLQSLASQVEQVYAELRGGPRKQTGRDNGREIARESAA